MKSTGVKIDPNHLTEEMRQETYPRLEQTAVFDRVEYTLRLEPGKDGIGAVAAEWLDQIDEHDDVVKKIELLLQLQQEAQREHLRFVFPSFPFLSHLSLSDGNDSSSTLTLSG